MSLPNETLSAIFSHLSAPTLATLARVSYRFNGVAERILYSNIHITDLISEESPLPLRTLWWCDAIERRAHLFESTRKVQIRWQGAEMQRQGHRSTSPPHPSLGVWYYHYLVGACERLGEVLRLLVFLESLDLFLGPANLIPPHEPHYRYQHLQDQHPHMLPAVPMHAIERVVHSVTLTHLRLCSLGAEWTKGAQPYTPLLSAFLSSLPALIQLRLTDLHASSYASYSASTSTAPSATTASVLQLIPPDALPCLSSFRGSPDAAASLLPGRPVRHLSLTGQDSDVNRDNLPKITLTSVPLRFLDLSAMTARPNLLQNVSTHLPMLEGLRVRLALRHTLHYAFSGIRILAGLTQLLAAFNQLAFLDLSPTDIDGVGKPDSSEELDLCCQWSRACPTLRRIIFPSQTEWLSEAGSNWVPVASCSNGSPGNGNGNWVRVDLSP